MQYLTTDKHSWTEAAAWPLNANTLGCCRWISNKRGWMLSGQESNSNHRTQRNPPSLLQELPALWRGDNARQPQVALPNPSSTRQRGRWRQRLRQALGEDADCAVTQSTQCLHCQLLKVTAFFFISPTLPRWLQEEGGATLQRPRNAQSSLKEAETPFCIPQHTFVLHYVHRIFSTHH